VQRTGGDLEEEPLLRIQPRRFLGRVAEVGGVEVGEAVEIPVRRDVVRIGTGGVVHSGLA
jgi:hypothetical protein